VHLERALCCRLQDFKLLEKGKGKEKKGKWRDGDGDRDGDRHGEEKNSKGRGREEKGKENRVGKEKEGNGQGKEEEEEEEEKGSGEGRRVKGENDNEEDREMVKEGGKEERREGEEEGECVVEGENEYLNSREREERDVMSIRGALYYTHHPSMLCTSVKFDESSIFTEFCNTEKNLLDLKTKIGGTENLKTKEDDQLNIDGDLEPLNHEIPSGFGAVFSEKRCLSWWVDNRRKRELNEERDKGGGKGEGEGEGGKVELKVERDSATHSRDGSVEGSGYFSVIDSSSGLQIRSNVCKYGMNHRTCNVTDSATRIPIDIRENICEETCERRSNENCQIIENNKFENENENENKSEYSEISEIASVSFFTDFKTILNELILIASMRKERKIEKNILEQDGNTLKNEKNFCNSETAKNVLNPISKEKLSFLSVDEMTYGECKKKVILNLDMFLDDNNDNDNDDINNDNNYYVNDDSNKNINNDDIHHKVIDMRDPEFFRNKNEFSNLNSYAEAKNILFTDSRFFTDWIKKSEFQ
jgi:hypothetical protein